MPKSDLTRGRMPGATESASLSVSSVWLTARSGARRRYWRRAVRGGVVEGEGAVLAAYGEEFVVRAEGQALPPVGLLWVDGAVRKRVRVPLFYGVVFAAGEDRFAAVGVDYAQN